MMKSWPLGLRAIASSIARVEELVALGGAQRRAQVGGVFLAEAHIERAGAGQPHAVAALAEIMGQRRDEAEPAAGLRDLDIAGRAAGAVVDVVSVKLLRESARTSDSGRYWSIRARRRSRPSAWSRSASGPCRGHAPSAISSANSSSLTPFSATALILIFSPAACAASMPSHHLVEMAPAGDLGGTCPGRACRATR